VTVSPLRTTFVSVFARRSFTAAERVSPATTR
jgi:hypothetical protein